MKRLGLATVALALLLVPAIAGTKSKKVDSESPSYYKAAFTAATAMGIKYCNVTPSPELLSKMSDWASKDEYSEAELAVALKSNQELMADFGTKGFCRMNEAFVSRIEKALEMVGQK
ncbi:hypothetical protein JQ543_21145 [Bradyrhizobium diazoefficiens]|nr:hypothetical protein [Bradyrhizobium diazoefficiens]MBR0850266.1 hypothetical protein [Bradyrhizobium diazoefficiens]